MTQPTKAEMTKKEAVIWLKPLLALDCPELHPAIGGGE